MRTFLATVLLAILVSGVAQAELRERSTGPDEERAVITVDQGAPDVRLGQDPAPGLAFEENGRRVALLYVGHGEPVTPEDGDVPITLADGTPFGPHGVSLGVPEEAQYTEWAAAYEEIATAMAYIFGDVNGNGIEHEIAISPAGDVPPFFVWNAFHASIYARYQACGNFSPHNRDVRKHVDSLDIEVEGAVVDVYIAFLDAVPRITDVVWEIAEGNRYQELVVVPMLVANSTHTDEVDELVEEVEHLTAGMEVLVTEPFFEIPFMQRRLRDAVISTAEFLRGAIPEDVDDHDIGAVLASHGTPYVPPFPEFGWEEGDIWSYLIPTEDAFHDEIAEKLPWMFRTGRMNYSTPSIEQALAEFEAEGFTHVMVVPTVFPTPAIHTMWDVANAAVGRAVLPEEGIVQFTRASGMTVYYSAKGFADLEPGRSEFREGLGFVGEIGVLEALHQGPEGEFTPFVPCPPGELCVTVTAAQITGSEMQFMLYEATESGWPQDFQDLPTPDWVFINPPPMPDSFPARMRIPLAGNLLPLTGKSPEGARMGLAIATADGMVVEPTDARGFSVSTVVHHSGGAMNYGFVNLAVPGPEEICLPGEICVTVTGGETTGPDLKLMLYIATEEGWPQEFLNLPTPSWVVTETTPVPETFPVRIRIPLEENLFAFISEPIDGQRLGLAVVTGVASNFIVEPTDARGFSAMTLVYESGNAVDYGNVELYIPAGDACDLNPYHPSCMSGALMWEEYYLGETDFVPGAIYMAVADLDEDGTNDIVMVGEPHFEDPDLPLDVLKLGIYYLNPDGTLRDTEIIDQWSETDPLFYSPWGVNVIQHGGAPMIIVGTNIPGLAPLEDGTGTILSYRRDAGEWVRSVVMANPDPTVTNYNAMIVVISDIDNDGDEDLAMSGAFQTSSVGNWMENTGQVDNPWIAHLQPMAPGTDPYIRGTLAYKSVDLNGDGYPEVVHNAMFDVANTDPPQFRGEIWLSVNPGPPWDVPWQMIVIDDDNWASADMWFHDFDGDGFLDLVANQIFNSTVTLYHHPGDNLDDPWVPEVIIDDLTSPSDMWLADMDVDGLMDVVSADHTAHRGVWHKNSGTSGGEMWQSNMIYRNIRLPGDFAMVDIDGDGDLDWAGTSLTLGQAFIVKQVQPDTSLVATISLPDGFDGEITRLIVALASTLPVTGIPAAILAQVENVDADGDGMPDVDQILSPDRDLVLAIPDVGIVGEYHVVATLYMEGGGQFQPVPGVDYMASSPRVPLGTGPAQVTLDLELFTVAGAPTRSEGRVQQGDGWNLGR